MAVNERAIKRLLFIIAVSVVAIFFFKMVLTKTIAGMSKAAADKKQATAAKLPTSQQASPDTPANTGAVIEAPAISVVDAAKIQGSPTSSIEGGER